MFNVQKLADFQVLPGLGHDPLICCNNEGNQVDTRGPGHHVFDKLFMTRHIHNTQQLPSRQFHVGETELNGDAPLLFLLQPVRIYPGQCLDK